MASQQIAPVLCPMCGARFSAPVQNIIDVSQDPAAKSRLLQGYVNVAKCPQCGNEGPMLAPFLYHDPEHELALVLMPTELNLHNDDQQKIIGDLTNRVVNQLPPEQRKMYLLTPKLFFTLQGLTDAVLQAEGISPEDLKRQRAKAQLIEQFLRAGDENALKALIKEHDADLDYEFFEMLTSSALAAQQQGQADAARALLGLRAVIAEWSSKGREAVAEVNAALGLGEVITRDELLDRLQATETEEEWEALVAAARSVLDYEFFQKLTAGIENAPDADAANRLKALRAKILDTTAKQDEEARNAMQRTTELLHQILESEDREAYVREHVEELDPLFFSILSAYIQNAQNENREDAVTVLRQVGNLVMKVLEENLPPEVRLLNQLMRRSYPEQTGQLLTEQRELIDDQLLSDLEEASQELAQSGQNEAAQHLLQVREQAETIRQS